MWCSRLLSVSCLLLVAWYCIEDVECHTPTYGIHIKQPPWDVRRWLQKEIDFPPATTKVSICVHLYIHYLYKEHSTLMTLDPYAVVDIYKQQVFLTMGAKAILGHKKVPVRKWFHLCVMLSNDPLIALDGAVLNTTSRDSHMESKDLILDGPHNLTLGVPGEGGQLFPPLGVRVTLPRIYPVELTAEQIASIAKCDVIPGGEMSSGQWLVGLKESTPVAGEGGSIDGMDHGHGEPTMPEPVDDTVMSTDLTILDKHGILPSVICPPHPSESFLVLDGTYSFQDAERWCESLGGRLPDTTNEDAFDWVEKLRLSLGGASVFIWFNRGDHPMCQMLWASHEHPRMIMNMACEEVCLSTHLLCQVPEPLQVSLRHNEMLEDPFFLVPDGTQPKFLSVSGRQLRLTRDRIQLIDKYGNVVSNATLPAHGFMGRHDWKAELNGEWSTMTLTTCGLDEFTCNIGLCIPLQQRCNGHDDCGDDSDETCTLLLPLPSSYRSSRPPNVHTAVALDAEFVGYQSIDVNNNLVSVELVVETTWQDNRVTVAQLSDNHHDNILQTDKLWYPSIVMPNSVFADRMQILNHEGTQIAFTAKKINPGSATVRDGYEGYIYNTSVNAALVRSERSTADYHCYFDLQLFPFDVHVCNVEIQILNSGSFTAYFDTEKIKVTSHSTTMPLFQIYEVRYSYDNTAAITLIRFKILLERQCGGFIMSIMAPSLFITVIGAFTTSFREDNFSDRIMVTLSCLIFDAALVSQSSAMIPESSYPKAFDIYFFYSASRLFSVFFFHLIFNLLRIRHEKTSEKKRRPRTTAALPFVPDPPVYSAPGEKVSEKDIYADLKMPMRAWMAMDPTLNPDVEKNPNKKPEMGYHKKFQRGYLIVSTLIDLVLGSIFFFWITRGRMQVFNDFDDSLI